MELRKANRIRTIQSSLAIENNTLTVEQVTAIVEGKRVLGSPVEIAEVKNALQAYELLLSLDPCSEEDLKKAHGIMMRELVDSSGRYRTRGVCIGDGEKVVHIAPPAERVPMLMADLFDWLKQSDAHPLVKSCVFHSEFEFIHPFQDGNGRMGRLWQTVILKQWKEIFAWLPVETLVKEHQKEYYDALMASDREGNGTKFAEFMLSLLQKAIEELAQAGKSSAKGTARVTVKVTANQQKILDALKKDPYLTQLELASLVGLARKSVVSNMKVLQEHGLVVRIGADKNGHWQCQRR